MLIHSVKNKFQSGLGKFFSSSAIASISALLLLSGCGENRQVEPAQAPPISASWEKNFGAPTSAKPMTNFAAQRFLEHTSFGPTPTSIAELKSFGMNAWIDQQFAAPVSQIDASFSENWDSNETPGLSGRPYFELFEKKFIGLSLSAPDQLRLRTTWGLSQFIVVSELKVQSFAIAQYFNTVQNQAFGNFADLLRAVAKSPSMGAYLDNISNKKEGICDSCSVNENFARELMQLFTLGVVKLNKDGSLMRDANGKLLETYTQDDVQAMARALTGWDLLAREKAPPFLRTSTFRYPLLANWKEAHDTAEKKLLGKTIAAGGTAEQDLESVITILMNHPNIAPFVSTRLIQHFVTSDPSPAYVKRVASLFENNGQGVRGDLKALLKAILLDDEARRGDDATLADNHVGKVREPALFKLFMLRGMGCQMALTNPDGALDGVGNQKPFNPASVFSFFSPTYRAPGSMLLSPEQKLLTSSEFSARLGGISWIARESPQSFKEAGCHFDEFVDAYKKSKRDFINLVSARYFRGAMSPPLRDSAEKVIDRITWDTTESRVAYVLQFILATPSFGVIK